MIDARARITRLVSLHLFLFFLLFARRPGTLLNPQFWAEDGAIFFADQIRSGSFHALASTYSGYYHALPRLVAFTVSVLPIAYAPLAYNLTALLIACLCCGLFAWPIYRPLMASDLLRALTCCVAATAVYTGDEVIGNLANVQWFLLIAAVLLVSFAQQPGPKSRWLLILLAACGLLIALSAPLAVVLSPWLLWLAIRKHGLARLPAICTLAGLLIQVWAFLHSAEPHTSLHTFRLSIFFVAVIGTEISRPVLTTLLGHEYLARGGYLGVVSKMMAALIVVSVLLTRLYVQLQPHRRRALSIALYVSLSLVAAAMLGRNLANAFTDPEGFRHLHGERYFFIPGCLFVFLAAFWIDHSFRSQKVAVKAALLLVIFGHGILTNFNLPPLIDLSWRTHAHEIEDWSTRHSRGEKVPPLTVPINPPPFTISLN